MKFFLSVIFGCIYMFVFGLTKVSAQEANFATNIVTTYTVQPGGLVRVNKEFNIENLQASIYLSSYSINFSDPQVKDLKVTYNNQELPTNISSDNGTTKIEMSFPDIVVGQGKKRKITLSYQTSTPAVLTGKVLEVHIPATTYGSTIADSKTYIRIPTTFALPTRINTQPTKISQVSGFNEFQFDNHNDFISMFFGSEQFFRLSIRYNLINEGSSEGIAQVALPPDTSFQRIQIESLEPRPYNIKVDEDGNWIASYLVPANSTITPQMIAVAKITLDPNPEVPVVKPQDFHLDAQEYWPVSSTIMKEITQQQSSTESIHNYVVNQLEYSTDLQNSLIRFGAEQALEKPNQAVCQEYADLFVTLARTSATPARVLTGYGFSTDSTTRPLTLEGDVLHAWADYFDQSKQLWIPVDPTWQDTTGGTDYFHQFDLNHIVFAINGKSSTLPYPGGSYKLPDQKSEDVEVKVLDESAEFIVDFDLSFEQVSFLGLKLPGFYKLHLKNETGNAWYNIKLNPKADNSKLKLKVDSLPDTILPYQAYELNLFVASTDWQPIDGSFSTVIEVNGQKYEQKIFNITGIAEIFYPGRVAKEQLAVVGVVFIVAIAGGSLLVFGRRGKCPVRRQGKKS